MWESIFNSITSNALSFIATIAAILSAISAFRSSASAKKIREFSESDYKNKQSNFSLYYAQGFRRIIKDSDTGSRKFLVFNLTIINKSILANTFFSRLELELIREDQSLVQIQLEHQAESSLSEFGTITLYPFIIRIDGKGSESKWLLFEEPVGVFEGVRINKYRIKIRDTENNEKSIDTFLLSEVFNEINS